MSDLSSSSSPPAVTGSFGARAAMGVDGAAEFAALLQQVSEQQASQDMALSRQADQQSQALMRKLQQGKNTKQKRLIEAAFQESGLVAQAMEQQQQLQDKQLQEKIRAGKKKKRKEEGAEQAAAAAAGEKATGVELLTAAVGEESAAEFAALLSQLSAEHGGVAQALSAEQQSAIESLLHRLMSGQTTKQRRLIERAFQEHGLVSEAMSEEMKRQEEVMAAKLAAVKKRKKEKAERAAAAAAQAAAEEADRQAAEQAEAEQTAAQFAALLKQASENQANQDMALNRQSELQSQQLMAKLLKGKNTKQKRLIERAFQESGLVDQALTQQQRRQEEMMAAKIAAGKKKKKEEQTEEKYADQNMSAESQVEEGVVDYLQQKYGEMLAEEEKESVPQPPLDPAAAILEKQEAIATATSLGMSAGADGVEVAQIAAQAAAMGLSKEQIEAAATAAAAVSASADNSEADHATFMDLFRKATEDAAAMIARRAAARSDQEDAFTRKLLAGKKTKQQRMVEQQMADILAANQKARSFIDAQDAEMARKLALGKKKRATAGTGADAQEANRLAAEALASEMLISNDALTKTAGQVAASEEQQVLQEIEALLAAPTILDELLAVSDMQTEEIERQAAESGISIAEIEAANQEVLNLDNMAAQLMLEKAREAEAMGDAEGAAAFMSMYRKMVEEQVHRQSAMRRQLDASEEALMRKLMKGKTTKQQKLIEQAFQNQALVDALINQEAARQQAIMEAKLAQGKIRKKNAALSKAAEDMFTKLRKIFLGAIRKLDATHIIRALEEGRELMDGGYLDINKPVKEATGEAMLHQAAKYGRWEVVEWLVKQGAARPNLPNSAGQTPLHFAALSLDPDGADQVHPEQAANTCLALIEAGADIHQEDVSFQTPQTIAAQFGFDLTNLANTPEAIEALTLQRQKEEAMRMEKERLEAGVEMQEEGLSGLPTASQEDLKKAAAIAAAVTAEAIAKLSAEQHTEESSSSSHVMSDPATGLPMTEAQLQQQKAEFESLMNEEKLELMTPLESAPAPDSAKTKAANLAFLQLCELFKDINNPRHELEVQQILKANVELIREGYLDLNKPVRSKQDGTTLLHAAVFHQKTTLVRRLLENRADPNKISMTGETPLHVACALVDREPHGKVIVALLLEAGGDPTLRDFRNGWTPFEHAPTAALKKWMEEWRPLAERQRLALANQMGGLDDLVSRNAANLKNAALAAESSFLDKLMRGKLTKHGKLLDEAIKNNDLLNARHISEQQKQWEMMQARLAKGKAKKPGLTMHSEEAAFSRDMMTGSKAELAARKKQSFFEDMLLQELSEATKDKIMLTAERYADHPLGMSGLDLAVLSKLRGMHIADAIKLLATESASMAARQEELNQAINAPGLDEHHVLEYQRQFHVAECNADIYADITNNMIEAEKKRQEELDAKEREKQQQQGEGDVTMMTEEELAVFQAKERLDEIQRRKEAAKAAGGQLPPGMLDRICQLFSAYIADNTGYEIEPSLIMQGALPIEDLQTYQLDTETIETMLQPHIDVEQAKQFIAKQSQINEAVAANLQRQLADENLPERQREEGEIQAKLCLSNGQLYDALMNLLLHGPAPPAPSTDSTSLSLPLSSSMGMDPTELASVVHPDTGLSVQMHIQEVVLDQMRELAAEYLGIEATELKDLSTDQLQQALAAAGVNVDILEELRKLTEAEAGKYLAKQMAKNEAESEMLKKLLKGKGLSAKKRAELLARQKALDDAADLYNDMLSTLLTGEKKKYAQLSREEQLAQDRMLAKMAARRRKHEQAELEARQMRQEEEIHLAQQLALESSEKEGGVVMKEVAVLDAEGNPLLHPDGTPQTELVPDPVAAAALVEEILARQGVLHQLIQDNPTLWAALQGIVAAHLGMELGEFTVLPPEDVQLKLAERSVDIDLIDYIRRLTTGEGAKHACREMGRAEAEAKMLRKLLKNKNLTPDQKEDLQVRMRNAEDNAKLYEDMLRELLAAEQKKYDQMSPEEQAAHDALKAKLALRKARVVAKQKERQVEESSPLLDLFDDLSDKGPFECRVCQTMNEAVNRQCKFCKKSRADTLSLPDTTLWQAHRMLHQCSCSMSVIEVVSRSIGPCTKRNFLHFMQAATLACKREQHVVWDTAGVDGDHLGALPPSASELVWGFNDWDIENPRYHLFREKHADPAVKTFIGWQDFRDECVQMPHSIEDYL